MSNDPSSFLVSCSVMSEKKPISERNQVGTSHRGSPFKETLTPLISDLPAMTLWPHITINNGV